MHAWLYIGTNQSRVCDIESMGANGRTISNQNRRSINREIGGTFIIHTQDHWLWEV